MKLRTVGIVGFGKYRGVLQPVTHEFGPGFNLIVGPNEAGKSTLQACIARTLFGTPRFGGFPDYTPWDGGDYQAWIEFDGDDGHVWRIVRNFQSKARRPLEIYKKPKSGGAEVLAGKDNATLLPLLERELGITDERVFYSTACISHVEIDPSDRRFSGSLRHAAERAIAGGVGESTHALAIARLNERLLALTRPVGGAVGPAVRIERELARLREQEVAAGQRHQRLHELHHTRRREGERVAHLRAETGTLAAQLENYRIRAEARERLQAVEAALSQTETRLGALSRLKEEIASSDRRLSAFPDFFRKDPGLVEKIVALDADLRNAGAAAESAQGELSGLPTRIADLRAKETELATRVSALEAEHAALGALAAAQAELSALDPRTAAIHQREAEIDDRLHKVDELRRKVAAAKDALERIPKAVRATPALEAKALAVQDKLNSRKKAQKETQTRFEEAKETFAGNLPSYYMTSLCLTLAALSLVTGTYFAVSEKGVVAVGLVFVAVAAGLAFAGVLNFRKKEEQRSEKKKELVITAHNAELAAKEVAAAESERKFLLQTAGLPALDGLLTAAAQARQLTAELAAGQSALALLVPTGADAALKAERESLKTEKVAVKARLDALRGVTHRAARKAEEVKARLAKLTTELPPAQAELAKLRAELYGEDGRRRAIETSAAAVAPRRAELERRKGEILALAAAARVGSLEELLKSVRTFSDLAADRRQRCSTFEALAKEGTIEALTEKRRALQLDRAALTDRLASVPGEALAAERVTEVENRLAHAASELERHEREFVQHEEERKHLERQELDLLQIRESIVWHERKLGRLTLRARALERAIKLLGESARHVREDLASPLQQAVSSVFMEMTRNSYTGVQVEVDPSEFTFRPVKGDRPVDPESLSRGTRDQLYFSIRYGLARVMVGSEREPFLILDDPFAHFDEERLRHTLATLRRIATRSQVLLFTKDVALAKEVAGWGKVITLER
ncbi:MAG: AAA family ATPase [Planctomycetes bacterium]|nr:AAA family ATPase [Planctomycetota bacterium]